MFDKATLLAKKLLSKVFTSADETLSQSFKGQMAILPVVFSHFKERGISEDSWRKFHSRDFAGFLRSYGIKAKTDSRGAKLSTLLKGKKFQLGLECDIVAVVGARQLRPGDIINSEIYQVVRVPSIAEWDNARKRAITSKRLDQKNDRKAERLADNFTRNMQRKEAFRKIKQSESLVKQGKPTEAYWNLSSYLRMQEIGSDVLERLLSVASNAAIKASEKGDRGPSLDIMQRQNRWVNSK